jgi:DNA-binding CsgD family transcriptional regulator
MGIVEPDFKTSFGSVLLSFLSDVVSASSSCYYRVDCDMQVEHSLLCNLSVEWLHAYQAYFHTLDPLHPSRYLERRDRVVTFSAATMGADRGARDYLNDFLVPQNTPYQVELYLRDRMGIIVGVSLLRKAEMGMFTPGEIERLKRVVPFVEYCAQRIDDQPTLDSLNSFSFTGREREISEMVLLGLANKEICRKLDITLPTVKTHLSRIFNKAGVHSRTELMRRIYLGN